MQHKDKYVNCVLDFSRDTENNEHPGRQVRGTVVHINMSPHKGGFEGVTRMYVAQNIVEWRSCPIRGRKALTIQVTINFSK
jgi:hypothetical protein